jgi:hypothetical protein
MTSTDTLHVETLTTHNAHGVPITATVVWADRPYTHCPLCHQGVDPGHCPVTLDGGADGGQYLQTWSLQHGCGEWLTIDWAAVGDDETVDQVIAYVTASRDERAAKLRADTVAALRRDLRIALDQLADGDDPDDVTTGSLANPGIYRDGQWLAWAYDPTSRDGDTITVHEDDLR